jgi:hypothetical protein
LSSYLYTDLIFYREIFPLYPSGMTCLIVVVDKLNEDGPMASKLRPVLYPCHPADRSIQLQHMEAFSLVRDHT